MVTTNIIVIGAYNMNPFLPVTFKNTDKEINTIAANNWFAEPNSGQMLLYPPKLNRYPPASVMIVAKYLFVRTFTAGETALPSSI